MPHCLSPSEQRLTSSVPQSNASGSSQLTTAGVTEIGSVTSLVARSSSEIGPVQIVIVARLARPSSSSLVTRHWPHRRSLVASWPRHCLSGLSLQASLLSCSDARLLRCRCSLPLWLSLTLSLSFSIWMTFSEMKIMTVSLSLFIL